MSRIQEYLENKSCACVMGLVDRISKDLFELQEVLTSSDISHGLSTIIDLLKIYNDKLIQSNPELTYVTCTKDDEEVPEWIISHPITRYINVIKFTEFSFKRKSKKRLTFFFKRTPPCGGDLLRDFCLKIVSVMTRNNCDQNGHMDIRVEFRRGSKANVGLLRCKINEAADILHYLFCTFLSEKHNEPFLLYNVSVYHRYE